MKIAIIGVLSLIGFGCITYFSSYLVLIDEDISRAVDDVRSKDLLFPRKRVIFSATLDAKFLSLMPVAVVLWNAAGFSPHLILCVDQGSAVPEFVTKFQSLCTELGLASFEFVHLTAFNRKSLPGISRYAAAASNRFSESHVVLTDLDLLPMAKARAYLHFLWNASLPNRINVDFVYPATFQCLNSTEYAIRETNRCSRTPRFRTCYLQGRGSNFARILLKNQGEHIKTGEILSILYSDEMIRRAYTGCDFIVGSSKTQILADKYLRDGPDVSFDEILFGKLTLCSKSCQPVVALGESNECVALVHQRNHVKEIMWGEFGNSWGRKHVTARVPDSAIDVHFSQRKFRASLRLEQKFSADLGIKCLKGCRELLEMNVNSNKCQRLCKLMP